VPAEQLELVAFLPMDVAPVLQVLAPKFQPVPFRGDLLRLRVPFGRLLRSPSADRPASE
jgi:hypothetical protein